MTHTIATSADNEFEYLASVLATWDETSDGIIHKRHALDQLLIRSEIDGYKKERVNEDRNILLWKKEGSDIAVIITRVGYGLYDVLIRSRNISIRALNIEEL